MTYLLATLYLAALGVSGVAALRRLGCGLSRLECWAYGLPLGNVAWSLGTLLLASAAGRLTMVSVLAPAAASVIAALWLWRPWRAARTRWRGRGAWGTAAGWRAWRGRIAARWPGTLTALVLGGFAVRWSLLWAGAFTSDERGLWAGHTNLWGDWALHLGDVTAFVYGDNFPPVNTRYLGIPLVYHYLASITAAALVKLGLAPTAALAFHSWAGCLALLLALYAFALRLTRDRDIAALAVALFLLGGTLAWLARLARWFDAPGDWAALLRDDGIAEAQHFAWPSIFFDLIEPQRGYLYGLPLALLILTLLLEGQARRRIGPFLAAGVAGGLLPFAHLSTLTALALIVPFAFLFLVPADGPLPADWRLLRRDPRRYRAEVARRVGCLVRDYRASLPRWLACGAVWLALAVPQLLALQGGQGSDLRLIRWEIGWVAPPDPWPWFWLKNLGNIVPLLLAALASRTLFRGATRRLLWAFMPTFAICNLVAFRPWDWDNTKLLCYWFLAACILVAALLARAWRAAPRRFARATIAAIAATMILTGLLLNLQQLVGNDRYLFLTAEEVRLAALVRERTDPHAVFATGIRHNQPIPVLAGRQVLMSYPGWLFSSGIDYAPRERDLRAIYAFADDAPRLLAQYGIDYLVIGPGEREDFAVNTAAIRARYGEPVIATEGYEIYRVR